MTEKDQAEVTDQPAETLPATRADIAGLFKDCVKKDGSLDMRSTFGRAIRAMKEILSDNPQVASDEMLKHDIAVLQTIERAIFGYVLSKPESIFNDEKETLNPLLLTALRIRDNKHKAIALLLGLTRRKAPTNKRAARDLNDISLD